MATTELREKIRKVIEDVAHAEPETVETAVQRIMDVVDPFRQAAFEEMDRYHATFADLAK